MGATIHPTAIVDRSAEIRDGVEIGPYAIVGADVVVGEGSRIGAGAHVEGPTVLGRENVLHPRCCVGFDPQDLKFEGETTRLEVGDRNHFREFSTVHRGTGHGGGLTTIGNDNLFMAYTHVAHDCRVGDRTIFANCGTLAGHVDVEDDAVVGAFSSVHQFCRVGRHAYIGGYSVVTRDALPYVKTVGTKPVCYGLNRIGLQRKGFEKETLDVLESAYRILVRSRLSVSKAVAKIEAEVEGIPEVEALLAFLAGTRRGVITEPPGRGGSRGA